MTPLETAAAVLLAAPSLLVLARLAAPGRRRPPLLSLRVPSVEETAASIGRFRLTAERWASLELAWERYSHGRALLLDEMRRAAAGPRRARKAPVPDRL